MGRMDELWLTQWTIHVSTGTPALRSCLANPRVGSSTTQIPQGDEITWWIAQMILSVPIPALLVYEITVLLLGALPQTLVDGSGPSTGEQYLYYRSPQF